MASDTESAASDIDTLMLLGIEKDSDATEGEGEGQNEGNSPSSIACSVATLDSDERAMTSTTLLIRSYILVVKRMEVSLILPISSLMLISMS